MKLAPARKPTHSLSHNARLASDGLAGYHAWDGPLLALALAMTFGFFRIGEFKARLASLAGQSGLIGAVFSDVIEAVLATLGLNLAKGARL